MKSIRLKNIFVVLLSAIAVITGALFLGMSRADLCFASDKEMDLDFFRGGGKPYIRISTWYKDGDLTYLKAFLAEQFPDYTFEFVYVDRSNYEPILDSQLSYKGAPDILYMDQEMIQKHAATGYIAPVTDLCEDFSKEAWDAFSYGNQMYAVPNTSQFDCIYYNKDLFEKKGIPVPNSYYGFVSVCDNMRLVKGITPFSVSFKSPYALSDAALAIVAATYFYSDRGSGFGGRLRYGRTTFREEFLPYMDDWKDLMLHQVFTKDMYTIDQATAMERFVDGMAGMTVGGPETYNEIIRRNPDMRIGTLPFYSREGIREAVIVGSDLGLSLNKNSRYIEDAMRVLEALSTPEGQQALWADRPGSQTYLKDVRFENSEVYDGIKKCRDEGRIFAPWMSWGSDLNRPVRYQLGRELQGVVLEKQTVEEAIYNIDKLVKQILHG